MRSVSPFEFGRVSHALDRAGLSTDIDIGWAQATVMLALTFWTAFVWTRLDQVLQTEAISTHMTR